MSEIAAEYDYIVVGAGAAGSIVAAKAAEAGHTVLLLELGEAVSPTNDWVWNPTQWNHLLADPAFEIGQKSTQQPNLEHRQLDMLQSRGPGGCQIHNAMVYVRGGAATYNHWASALGCTGWDWNSLLPYFEAIERRMVLTAQADDFTDSLIAAAGRLGYRPNLDYNSGDAYGAVRFQFTQRRGPDGALRRTTSYQSFIAEADLPTLTVVTGAAVRRLVMESGGCVGVEFKVGPDGPRSVRARRDVVLSAGAIFSPAILLRSGIGPAEHLRACGIPLVHDLPMVGQNFHDDLGCGLLALALRELPATPNGFLAAGVFASDPAGPPAGAFGAINLELQISTSNMGGPLHSNNLSYALIGASAMHLASRGTVSLNPADPWAEPFVDPNWLSAPGDMARCLAALDLAHAVAAEPGFALTWGLLTFPNIMPEPWIRWTGTTVQHYVGSCAMGTGPGTSVVDPDLRVHSVPGLRVIDASVAPTTVSGNTAGVAMVIGAMGASRLLAS